MNFIGIKMHGTTIKEINMEVDTDQNAWKVLKCGAGEGWRRSVGPIV